MTSSANTSFAAALADSLAQLGVVDVCLSPGSRNTPLTLAFADHADARTWIHHDERSAGFFAIGLARATGRPVALVCTSGTAAVEYHPAVVEAAQSRVPLIVLTADRPPELRDVGAPQAIDQIKLYGDAVKWFHQGAPPGPAEVAHAPHLAAHAYGTALESPAGPVHLNLPFREPLLADHRAPPTTAAPPAVTVGTRVPDPATSDRLAATVGGDRVLFVVGAVPSTAAPELDRLATKLNAAVLADPQSGMRFGPHSGTVVAAADLLAAAGALDTDPPTAVVRWGALPTSKPLWRWLQNHADVSQILVDDGGHRDPLGSASLVVNADPGATAAAWPVAGRRAAEWPQRWLRRGKAAIEAAMQVLNERGFPNEPSIAQTVVDAAPSGGALFAGSSMPIRDVDTFAAPRSEPLLVLANRGANGIDGSISTAAGIAAAGKPTVALIGDVAALHDVGALATVARMGLPLTVVVVHNDGGGIFELLPQADPANVDPGTFERTFGTPHGTDFVAVATAFGLEAHEVKEQEQLAALVATTGDGPRLLQVRTDRKEIAPLRHEILQAVRAAAG